ncbi:MAG: hypothetical protein ABJF23_22470 [Bryobacteraceae bacterium]
MCDFSLMAMNNRLAVEGEDLVAHRFKSGATGLVSHWDFGSWTADKPTTFWGWLMGCFSLRSEPGPVVCIPPGTRVRLHGAYSGEKAIFTQIPMAARLHRDALFLESGETILVQLLPEGQRMTVLWMSDDESLDQPEDAQPELVFSR